MPVSPLIFEQLRTGGDRNFGYLLADRSAARGVLIDPSYAPEVLVQRARDQGISVDLIVNTHGHPDHINGNDVARELTGAPIAGHPGLPSPPDVVLADGQEVPVGSLRLQVLHTPGHSDDHVVLYESTHHLLITGDLLFVGKVGGTRTDDDGRTEWRSLQHVLSRVPDVATVWPGHDYGVRPSSTIALEKAANPFLRCRDVEEFLKVKRDWPALKQQYGLK
jgi:glyoxylase-like metal-dependent hydrolase (beta-lactamase superfamily II)